MADDATQCLLAALPREAYEGRSGAQVYLSNLVVSKVRSASIRLIAY